MMNKKILRDINYGMYIVTTKNDREEVGCTINTLVQITSDNPTIIISLNKNNYTNQIIKKTKKFAVNILSEEVPSEIIGTFGFQTSREVNKFENIKYNLIEEMPVLDTKICGYLICEVINIIDVDTHDIFLAKIINMDKKEDITAMTYKYYHEVIKGKTAKNAPTYIEEKENISNSKKYRCKICGYIYDDEKEEIPFEELPDDWKCKICGAPKSMFEKI